MLLVKTMLFARGSTLSFSHCLSPFSFQILMSVQEEHTPAVLMLRAITPKGHITAFVNLGIMETDGTAKVYFRFL